jgi:hypothetical protein
MLHVFVESCDSSCSTFSRFVVARVGHVLCPTYRAVPDCANPPYRARYVLSLESFAWYRGVPPRIQRVYGKRRHPFGMLANKT